MVLTIDNAGALVSGSIPGVTVKEDPVEMQRVKILRSFSDGKSTLEKGAVLTIPKWLALQARSSNKVEFLPDPKPEAPLEESKLEAGKVDDSKKSKKV